MNSRFKFNFGRIKYDFSTRTYIMGILNVTPDSFFDGGKFLQTEKAVELAMRMVENGADIIDVGGESTRPGSEPLPLDEELQRVVPVIKELSKVVNVPISVDTYKSKVAETALDAGACIVNDISAMTFDREMAKVVKKYGASVVLMHIKGTPKNMQENPIYNNVVEEILKYLMDRVNIASDNGIEKIIIDPGIGFGKKFEHNIEIIRNLETFKKIGYPLLVGPSRKSFIGNILNLPPTERLEGTASAVTACILNGANIVRVHDVKEMKRVAMVADALKVRTYQ